MGMPSEETIFRPVAAEPEAHCARLTFGCLVGPLPNLASGLFETLAALGGREDFRIGQMRPMALAPDLFASP